MKLISMTDFVLNVVQTPNVNEAICWEQTEKRLQKIYKYSLFLKQPLELWMFVPCDEDGVWLVLEEPRKHFGENYTPREETHTYYVKYQQAKERCLFEGFECQKHGGKYLIIYNENPIWVSWNNSKIIENLTHLKPILTLTAIKQLGFL